MKIKLLASVPAKSLRKRMKKNIEKCESIRIVVAYWTLPPDFFYDHEKKHNKFIELLGKKDSFICVDMQNPTNIYQLKKFKVLNPNANIHLHHYTLVGNVPNEQHKENLLHSKMIVFDYGKNKVEVWLGSHNFTKRALLGINLEASLAIKMNKQASLYMDIDNYVKDIKEKRTIPFNEKHSIYYKYLQGNKKGNDWLHTITLVNTNKSKIERGTTIQLLSLDNSNFNELKVVKKKIILEIVKANNCTQYFKCVILLAGETTKDNEKSYKINFPEMQYGILEKGILGALLPEDNLKSLDAIHIKFFTNIEIKEEITDTNFVKIANKIYDTKEEKIEIPNFAYEENGSIAIDKIITLKNVNVTENDDMRYNPKYNLTETDLDNLRKYHERIIDILKRNYTKDVKKERDNLKKEIPAKTVLKSKKDNIFWLKNITYKHKYWKFTRFEFVHKIWINEISKKDLIKDFVFVDEIIVLHDYLKKVIETNNINYSEWLYNFSRFMSMLIKEHKRFIEIAIKEGKKNDINPFLKEDYPDFF